MPGKAVGIQMNAGYPGNFARNADCVIENRLVLDTDSTGPSFGDPVIKNNDNTVSKFGASGTLAAFKGVAVRNVKTPATFVAPDIGSYEPGEACDVLTRGNVSVKCCVGTPAAGGKVYVRTVLGSPVTSGSVVGGFEAAAAGDGGTTVELTNCEWATGLMDTNRVTELAIKTRN